MPRELWEGCLCGSIPKRSEQCVMCGGAGPRPGKSGWEEKKGVNRCVCMRVCARMRVLGRGQAAPGKACRVVWNVPET